MTLHVVLMPSTSLRLNIQYWEAYGAAARRVSARSNGPVLRELWAGSGPEIGCLRAVLHPKEGQLLARDSEGTKPGGNIRRASFNAEVPEHSPPGDEQEAQLPNLAGTLP